MDTKDPHVRVMPYYPINEMMLAADGLTLIDPIPYVIYLAKQIADLIAFFESRQRRSTGEVRLDGPSAPVNPLQNPPVLNWRTPNTSGG